MIGIVLCAGYATRLYPLTEKIPKPLLKVGDKPMIEHILSKMEEVEGLTKVYVVTNARFFQNFEDWRKTYQGKLTITILNDHTTSDEDKLGPIGDLAFVLSHKKVQENVLIIAGDNLIGFNLRDMQDMFREKDAPVIGFYDLKDKDLLANKFGVGVLDKDGKIISFEEKPTFPQSSLAATCCYMFRKEDCAVITALAAEKGAQANAGDVIPALMQKGTVFGFTFREFWFDIGSKEQLEEARRVYGG